MQTTISAIIKKQKEYFLGQNTKDISFRIENLKRLKATIKKYEDDILNALEHDLGKHPQEGFITEVGIIYSSIDLFIKKIRSWAKPVKVHTPIYQFGKSYIEYEPYGTVLIIAPFNYSFQLAIEPLIGALAAGNTAVVKPSELSEETAKVINKIISEVYSEEYIAVVEGGVDVTTELLSNRFDYIFFTGSVQVGKIVMQAASKYLTPVTLELGGKSPAIVDDTFNLKLAAERIVWGKLINNGQTCIAPDYILVKDTIKKELITHLENAIVEFYSHDIKGNSDYGRIINERHAQRLADIIEEDKAYLVYGGAYDIENKYIEPTLFDISNTDVASMRDEIFGPILPIMEYKELSDVVQTVREFEKPLAMYIFSNNKDTQEYLQRNILSGGISINDTIKHVSLPNLPFGGVGNSGIGAYHGVHSFELFSHKRGVYINKLGWNIKQIFPPFSKKNENLIRKLFRG